MKIKKKEKVEIKSTLDRLEEELEIEGIEMFENDSVDASYLKLPAHLDDTDSKDLGRYLHTFTQQKMWSRTLIARAGALLREENDKLDSLKNKVFSSLPVKMSVKEKELKMLDSEESSAIVKRAKYLQEKYNMLDSYIKNLEDGIFSISREISRRGGDWNELKRTENVSAIRKRR